MQRILYAIIVTFSVVYTGCSNNSSNQNTPNPKNGDLNQTFVAADTTPTSNNNQNINSEKERLLSEGWEEKQVQNGPMPACYNFKPKRGNVNNYLEIHVGGGTDVSIKVMEFNSSKCVRYVFINSGSTYFIRNMPEGKYYLKIAYGKNWISKAEKGQCKGKFTSNQLYEKGQDILDFNVEHTENGYNIPSFKLQLDVISNSTTNSFNSDQISEDEFNM